MEGASDITRWCVLTRIYLYGMRVSPPQGRPQVFTASPLTLHTRDYPGLGGASQDLPRLFPAGRGGEGGKGTEGRDSVYTFA